MTDNEVKTMKKISMAVSIKHIDGQPNEFRVDFHAEAELPDDATLEKLKDQMNDFKHLAKHCTNKDMDNHSLPQSIPDTKHKPAISVTASDSNQEVDNHPASDKEDSIVFAPIPVPSSAQIPNRASAPSPKPATRNKGNSQEKQATTQQVNMVHAIIEKKRLNEQEIFKEFGVSNFYNMTHQQVAEFKRRYDP
jgi:hypothetical protein